MHISTLGEVGDDVETAPKGIPWTDSLAFAFLEFGSEVHPATGLNIPGILTGVYLLMMGGVVVGVSISP